MSYSLFDQLTDTTILPAESDQSPAATDLSAFLLSAVGQDACNATRNTQTLYRFVSRARDVSKDIKTLIVKVDAAGTDALAAFRKYTKMVGPLEERVQPSFYTSSGSNSSSLS